MLARFLSSKVSLIMPLLLQDSDTTVSDKPDSVRYSIKFVNCQKKVGTFCEEVETCWSG